MNFSSSTHKHHYIFTAKQLEDKRAHNNGELADRVKKVRLESGMPENSEKGPLTVAEEQLLLNYYAHRVQVVVGSKNWPLKIKSSAIMFLKRFYLQHSVMEHNIVHIMITCLYLACKVEEYYHSAEDICELLKVGKKLSNMVLENELVVLAALDFNLVVYHPYRSVDGFVEELKLCRGQKGSALEPAVLQACADDAWIDRVRRKANGAIDVLLLTDAAFLFPPGNLALAAMRSAFNHLKLPSEGFLKCIVAKQAGSDNAAEDLSKLKATLNAIDAFGAEGTKFFQDQKEQIKALDAKMRQFNPLLDPGTKAYKQAMEKRKQLRQQRKQAKQRKFAALHVADMIGSPLPVMNGEPSAKKQKKT